MVDVKLEFDLNDKSSMKAFYNLVVELKKNTPQITQVFLERSLDWLEKQAQMYLNLAGKVKTGTLRDSFRKEVEGNIGKLTNYASYAVFVEFGTGIKGIEGTQHPHADKSYYRQTPWWYFDKDTGEYVKTFGQAGYPFMFHALTDYYNGKYIEIYKQVFSEYINIHK